MHSSAGGTVSQAVLSPVSHPPPDRTPASVESVTRHVPLVLAKLSAGIRAR
jgi:hypothetical protein